MINQCITLLGDNSGKKALLFPFDEKCKLEDKKIGQLLPPYFFSSSKLHCAEQK